MSFVEDRKQCKEGPKAFIDLQKRKTMHLPLDSEKLSDGCAVAAPFYKSRKLFKATVRMHDDNSGAFDLLWKGSDKYSPRWDQAIFSTACKEGRCSCRSKADFKQLLRFE